MCKRLLSGWPINPSGFKHMNRVCVALHCSSQVWCTASVCLQAWIGSKSQKQRHSFGMSIPTGDKKCRLTKRVCCINGDARLQQTFNPFNVSMCSRILKQQNAPSRKIAQISYHLSRLLATRHTGRGKKDVSPSRWFKLGPYVLACQDNLVDYVRLHTRRVHLLEQPQRMLPLLALVARRDSCVESGDVGLHDCFTHLVHSCEHALPL
mmetsp:Transcript_161757/g.295264  ORF Transcript_161757/g.295264 Transcript_161757/m.295264 type:complete len:208 (-) Transcript_161757:30-653(-)